MSAGFGTMGNWNAEYLATLENIKLNHIAYKGGSQAIVDLIAGHVKASVLTWTAIDQHVRAGTLDALAVTSANRLPYLPDIADLPRARPQGFRLADLVLAVGAAEAAARHRREDQRGDREGDGPARDPEDDRARRDRDHAADAGRAEHSSRKAEIDRWAPLVRRIMAERQK